MFSALCLLISTAILFFVLRYRVHLHVTYTNTQGQESTKIGPHSQPRRRPRASDDHAEGPSVAPKGVHLARPRSVAEKAQQTPVNLESKARQNDLVSALKHQGCSTAAAKEAATRAMSHQDEQLAVALRRAIDYAREAA